MSIGVKEKDTSSKQGGINEEKEVHVKDEHTKLGLAFSRICCSYESQEWLQYSSRNSSVLPSDGSNSI